jgi:hypothetical protein
VAVGIWIARSGAAHRLEVRRPQPRAAAPTTAETLEPSLLRVPVRVELPTLVGVVDDVLPRGWGSLEERMDVPEHDNLDVAVRVERGPVHASFQDSMALLSTRLSYRARAWYDPPLLPEVSTGCGLDEEEPAPRIDVALVSSLVLDREWRLRSSVRPGTIVPASDEDRDRCTVTILGFDMTGRVVDAARDLVHSLGPEADSALAAVDVRADFAHWWQTITEPIRLDDDVWLVLAPERVARGAIRGTGNGVETVLSLTARPRVVVGDRPALDPTPLPPLEMASGSGRLVVRAEAAADYDEIGERINGELAGVAFSTGGRTVRLRRARLSGVGDGRVAVALELDGDVHGTLYLVGTPTHDPAAGQVTLPDLDFDVASREALVAGAAFVARVGLIERIRSYAHLPLDPVLAWAREKVETGFNARLSDQVRLEGAVDSISVVGLRADASALRVQARVAGQARLVVGSPGGGG